MIQKRDRRNPYSISDLLYLMSRLRDPKDGCPWDLKQTYKTIASSTLEEAYEVVDAIEDNDFSHLKEELGDLLFQVIFYSQLGDEENRFDFHSIASNLVEKLIRRHPHVFPEGQLHERFNENTKEPQEIQKTWENVKQKERELKGSKSAMDDVPLSLPSLTRAAKLQKRAAHVGFDWHDIQGPIQKVREELAEVEQALADEDDEAVFDEIGDLFFSVVNISRFLKFDPEAALRKANHKFEDRFRFMEQELSGEMQGHPVEELTVLWDRAKRNGL